MGPTLSNGGKIISLLGVKGGVGCSILTSLIARSAAKTKKIKIGIVDGSPFSYSLASTYFSVSNPKHYLTQLLPYSEHLTPKLIESYFSETSEGASYIPLRESESEVVSFSTLFPLLEKLAHLFSYLLVDLSSFPLDQHQKFIEKSSSVLFVSSFETSALKAAAQWEKQLLSLHLKSNHFNLILNQQNPSQAAPANIPSLFKTFNHAGSVSFLGDDFSFRFFESNTLTNSLAESLNSILEKMTTAGEPKPKAAPSHLKNNFSETGAVFSPYPREAPSLSQVNELHQKLLERLRQSGAMKDQKNPDSLQRKSLEPAAREILNQLIQELKIEDRETRLDLAAETLNLAFGLGPLETLLQNEEINEIMVNGPHQVYIEKKGVIEKTNISFLNDQQLRTIIERILAPIGRRIDESQPFVDGRLPDGSRVNAVISPVSLNGSTLTIRKFSKRKLTMDDLIKYGSLTEEAADFLGACVKAKINIIVSGGTGSGKTTLLNILSNFIPENERIVTIEDSAELQLSQEHVVRLESRPANLEGNGQVTIRDLVTNALRMRPDRIVVGECRGGEALDMLQAMNTGHDGSLTTAHANSPRDVLTRLETMCLFTGMELPLRAIREQVSRAIQLVVQQSRLANGKRAVTQISEVQGMEGDVIITQDLFSLEEEKGLQRHPFAPSFLDDLTSTGYLWPGRKEKKQA